MNPDSAESYALLCLAAIAAAAINSIAGGGTLLTFPALLGVLPPGDVSGQIANGTNKFAIVPGTIAGALGYREELYESRRLLYWLLGPSLLGAVMGSLLVTRLPAPIFSKLVPWLILVAALLLVIQQPLSRWARGRMGTRDLTGWGLSTAVMSQFVIALYGGYFGAGIGILMLTTLGFMGLRDIHHMNAVKNVLASLINTISALTFVIDGFVRWDFAVAMAASSIVGGYYGARFARRLPARWVRWAVVAIGVGLAVYYFRKQVLG